jgi:hypothetical protein
METVQILKKARDEVQALIDGSSSKLSPDVTRWILNDMRQSGDYTMPMQQAASKYPELQRDLQDAKAAFNNFGLLPDVKTIGGRLFVEKILSVTLHRLNGMLYTLGEQETPYGDDGSLYGYDDKALAARKAITTKRKDILKRAFASLTEEIAKHASLSKKTDDKQRLDDMKYREDKQRLEDIQRRARAAMQTMKTRYKVI